MIPAVVNNKNVLSSSSLQMVTNSADVTYNGLRRRSNEGQVFLTIIRPSGGLVI